MRGGGLVSKFYRTGEAKKLGQSDSDNYLFSLNIQLVDEQLTYCTIYGKFLFLSLFRVYAEGKDR
jgi:hypothetical protein